MCDDGACAYDGSRTDADAFEHDATRAEQRSIFNDYRRSQRRGPRDLVLIRVHDDHLVRNFAVVPNDDSFVADDGRVPVEVGPFSDAEVCTRCDFQPDTRP